MSSRFVSYSVAAAVSLVISSTAVLAQKPDPTQTPGAKTKASDAQVCAADFEASLKPVSGWQRQEALKRYGKRADDYPGDLDLLIPASLGGSTDPDNLWPQPVQKNLGPDAKDALEVKLRALVCDKTMTLKQAQDAIRKDWVKAYDKYVTEAPAATPVN